MNNNTVNSAIESLSDHGFDGMAQALTILMNEVMKMERSHHLQSFPYERTPDRQDYANGYKPKRVNTRIGRLDFDDGALEFPFLFLSNSSYLVFTKIWH